MAPESSELILSRPQSWPALWWAEARERPLTAGALAAAGLVLSILLGIGGVGALQPDRADVARLALLGGLAGFGATALGAAAGVALRNLSSRAEDSLLGFAAGMMLAASSFSLLLPGLAAGREITGSGPLSALVVSIGLALGVALMLGLDRFFPHEHPHGGPHGPGAARLARVWLFVLAITLHNLPEGMAIGVSFARGDLSVGLPLTTAIALQDVPEGLAVAIALRAAGLGVGRAAALAAASGLMEPLGAVLGVGLSSGFALAYPIGLGLAAGAMIFVVSHEVIPETHRNGHQTPATLGLMVGFAVMMGLDAGLG
jgi:ZIP family zinc transporter